MKLYKLAVISKERLNLWGKFNSRMLEEHRYTRLWKCMIKIRDWNLANFEPYHQ
jgi:hypothetical protein